MPLNRSTKKVFAAKARKRSLALLQAAHKKSGISQDSFYKKMKEKREITVSSTGQPRNHAYSRAVTAAVDTMPYEDAIGSHTFSNMDGLDELDEDI
mmetsp:Transcript_19531/g.25377  ORF Transcript_19531/g.25377 Transcript_19531/m.25377 type:complete len:96 (-) Transcript_19531:23-310(-)